MPAKDIFRIDMALGYLAWALCIASYIGPRLRAMDRIAAHRAIATFHSFRFFGLVFLLPGFVGPHLPEGFARLFSSDRSPKASTKPVQPEHPLSHAGSNMK
jgi:hypothetical protein